MVVHSCAANQELAYLLTQLLTMTTTHQFPSLVAGGPAVAGAGVVVLRQLFLQPLLTPDGTVWLLVGYFPELPCHQG